MGKLEDLKAQLQTHKDYVAFEDIAQAMLSRVITAVPILTKIPPKESAQREYPMIIVRRQRPVGLWGGDPRGLLDDGGVSISVFTYGINAQSDGAEISEGIRGITQKATEEKWYFPGLGSIVKCTMIEEPNQENDWATSDGPVQFADLPLGVVRHTTNYRMLVRPDMQLRR